MDGHEPFWDTPAPLEPCPCPSDRVIVAEVFCWDAQNRAGWVILGGQPRLPPALSQGTGRCDLQALGPGSVELAARSFGPQGHFLISECPCYRFHCSDREIHPEERHSQRH